VFSDRPAITLVWAKLAAMAEGAASPRSGFSRVGRAVVSRSGDYASGRMSARADVIVLRAGMVGVSVALHLQKRGRDIVLIDRRDAGEATSYGNAGLIRAPDRGTVLSARSRRIERLGFRPHNHRDAG
jgi:hypothetical protein